jgi:hypothetical protein
MLILKQNAANTVPTPPAGKGTIFLDDSDTLSVKTSDGNVENFPTVAASNAQVVFINGTALTGEAAFTYDFNNNILTVSGNIAAGNVKTDNLLYSNGVPWDLSDPGGSNTQIQFNDDESFGGSAAFTFNKSSNLVTVSANLDANNLNATTHITSGNVWANTGTIGAQTLKGEGGNISNVTAGNITGQVANALVAGTVYTAAQPNITSVGSLTGLTVTGNANVGNLGTAQVLASANVTAPQLISNVSTGTAPLVVTSTTVVANLRAATSNVANTVADAAQPNITSLGTLTAVAVTGNITGGNVYANSGTIGASLLTGTLTTNAQPNITSVGTLSSLTVTGNASAGNLSTGGNLSVSGNAIITGNLTVDGNLVYVNVETFSVEDPIIQLQTGPNGAAPTSNSGKDVGSALNYYDSQAQIAFMGWDVSNAEFGLASQASITNEVVTFSTYGNLRAGVYFGNAAGLTNIPSGNISGQVANALVAGTVYTAAQPNITSLGTLSSLAVSGNASAGNVNTAGKVVASTLESNVATGTAPLTVASTTKVTNLNADLLDGYDTATAATANTVVVRNADGSFSANIVTANLSGNATTAGTVVTAAQPNITSVGTLTGLGVNGNIAAVNITANTGVFTGNGSGLSALGGANVTGQVGNALVAGTVYTNAQPNITSVGTLSSLAVTGNATAGNVYANSGTVGASLLTGTLTTAAQPNITSVGTLSALTVTGNVSAGNLSGTLLTGTLATAAQPNITSVGTLTSLAVTGNVSAGNVSATGISGTTLGGTLTTAAQPNITSVGTLSSLTVTGNVSAGNVSATSGAFTNVSGNGSALSSITGGNVTGQVANALVAGTVYTAAQPNITSVGTLTGLGVNGNIDAVNITANTGVFTGNGSGLSAIAGGNVTGQVANALVAGTVYTAAQPNITSVGTLVSLAVTGNVTAANFVGNLANGNSDISIPAANGNINFDVGGTANVLVVTTTGANIAGTLNATGNANVGNIGAATAIITTGNITTINSGLLQNGNSNISITANGNINISATGTPNELVITSTGVNVAGTLNATGNANVGNLGTAQVLASANVTAPQLISNVSTGTAPLVVSSTTVVANLRAATSNVANTVNDAAQPNITSLGTLTSVAVTGNGTFGNVYANSGTIGASLLTGTLTTAAQPNVTSLGTLTGLGVNGNITAANITANTGVFTGNGSGLSQLAGGNVTGQVGNALVASTVYTNAQPNITSVGTLSSLAVTANVAAGNLTTTGVLSVTGTGVSSIAGNLDMTSNNIINLATPVASTDAATKQYVDDLASTALVYHEGVIAATTGTLASATGGTITYNNGTAGVGATLTTTGTFNLIDTANVQTVGTRILVKNEANAAHNGVYTYTSTTVITRATDADSYGPGADELSLNNYFFVSGGSVNKGSAYVLDAPTGTITFGTSNIEFAQFSSSQVYLAGTGLTLSNLTFSVNASQTQVTALGTVTTGTWNSLVGSSATFAAGLSGANLASITGANVTGTVPAATVAGTVTTAAQPNITSVGTLTGLGVNGTVTAVAFTANTGVFTGNGSALTALNASNISTGTLAQARLANASVTLGNTALTLGSTVTTVAGLTSVTSTTFVGALTGAATTAGTVTTAAQPNITSVGTLTSLSVTGNVSAGNVSGTLLTGTLTTAAQPNVTSLGTLTGLGVNGTITGVNITANTGVFTGNGSALTALNASNISSGTLAQARLANASTTLGSTALTLGATNTTVAGMVSLTSTQLFATANITTPQFISNVATGTAPFVVTSTTQVANLNVATAGTAGTVTTAAQSNITSVGTLTSLNSSGNITAPNLIANTGFVISSVNAAVSAAGTAQGNATALTRELNVTSTVASGAGVALPTAVAGMRVTIINTAANAVLVYPASGGKINSLATNAAFSQAAGAKLDFVATSTTQWYTLNATYG